VASDVEFDTTEVVIGSDDCVVCSETSDVVVLKPVVELTEAVVVVVVVVVVIVVVVASSHLTYSGQLQVSILESKYRLGGQDIRTGVSPTHS